MMLLQKDYASKPVSSICGWLLIPSKEVCGGQLHSEPLILHLNIHAHSIGEAITKPFCSKKKKKKKAQIHSYVQF